MRRPAGQVVVESALAVTAFMLILFGILDFGRAFWTWQSLSTGAREAVRWAIVHGADAGLSKSETATQGEAWVLSQFGSTLPANVTVMFSWPDGSNEPGQAVRVSLKSDFAPATPLLGTNKIPLEGLSQMEIIR